MECDGMYIYIYILKCFINVCFHAFQEMVSNLPLLLCSSTFFLSFCIFLPGPSVLFILFYFFLFFFFFFLPLKLLFKTWCGCSDMSWPDLDVILLSIRYFLPGLFASDLEEVGGRGAERERFWSVYWNLVGQGSIGWWDMGLPAPFLTMSPCV